MDLSEEEFRRDNNPDEYFKGMNHERDYGDPLHREAIMRAERATNYSRNSRNSKK
jgi:hypothetical protein